MYVRYEGGDVVETATWPQPDRPDWPEEEQIQLPEDHLDVAAFLAGPPEPPSQRDMATAIADAIDSSDTTALRVAIAQFPE